MPNCVSDMLMVYHIDYRSSSSSSSSVLIIIIKNYDMMVTWLSMSLSLSYLFFFICIVWLSCHTTKACYCFGLLLLSMDELNAPRTLFLEFNIEQKKRDSKTHELTKLNKKNNNNFDLNQMWHLFIHSFILSRKCSLICYFTFILLTLTRLLD